MASKVTPSIPGAPSFFLAISYAARRVSILQTWTYSPQKRQDGSAFALTYSLPLRSCKPMDAFIISSLPSLCWRHCKWQGPFAPRTLLRFIAVGSEEAPIEGLASVRRSNGTCSFPAFRFHEWLREIRREGISETRLTSLNSPRSRLVG